MTALVVVEGVAIALLGVLVLGLLRSQAQVLDLVRGREPASGTIPATSLAVAFGAPAPPVIGVTPGGAAVGVDVTTGPVLLAFLTEGCRECAHWWAALASAERRLIGPTIAVLTPSPDTERAAALGHIAPGDVPVVMSSKAWETYGVTVASTFVLITEGRVRAAGRASSWDELALIVGRSPGVTAGT